MLSPYADQRKAAIYYARCVERGIDMSRWGVLKSHPTTLSPESLVLLSYHTGDDIGTLLSNGIGVNNRVCDLQTKLIIGEIRPRRA